MDSGSGSELFLRKSNINCVYCTRLKASKEIVKFLCQRDVTVSRHSFAFLVVCYLLDDLPHLPWVAVVEVVLHLPLVDHFSIPDASLQVGSCYAVYKAL